jgi:hypothetical protein
VLLNKHAFPYAPHRIDFISHELVGDRRDQHVYEVDGTTYVVVRASWVAVYDVLVSSLSKPAFAASVDARFEMTLLAKMEGDLVEDASVLMTSPPTEVHVKPRELTAEDEPKAAGSAAYRLNEDGTQTQM